MLQTGVALVEAESSVTENQTTYCIMVPIEIAAKYKSCTQFTKNKNIKQNKTKIKTKTNQTERKLKRFSFVLEKKK